MTLFHFCFRFKILQIYIFYIHARPIKYQINTIRELIFITLLVSYLDRLNSPKCVTSTWSSSKKENYNVPAYSKRNQINMINQRKEEKITLVSE